MNANNTCTNCVQLTDNGTAICYECHDYKTEDVDWGKLEKELEKVIHDHKGKGPKYDVMVPFTGGKDSSFVLYYLRKKFNLRILAFTWDNGLIRDTAWENIRRVVKNLDIDHKIFKWDLGDLKTLWKATFRRESKVCYCPVFVFLSTYPVALREKIPLIITGFSEGQREMDHSFVPADQETQKQKFLKTAGLWKKHFTGCLDVYNDPELKKDLSEKLFGDITRFTDDPSKIDFYPYLVPLSNYVNWTSLDRLEAQLREIGWERAANTISHSSCFIEPVKGYLEGKRNLNEIRSELSYVIRAGGITREQGLKELNDLYITQDRLPDNIGDFCEFLDITKEEFITQSGKKMMIPDHMKDKVEEKMQEMFDSLAWIMGIRRHKKAKFV